MEQKSTKNRKRRFKLPFSAFITYLLLLAIALSGVTFSKYVTGTTLGDAARVAYMKDITISETGNFSEQNKWIITPGVDMIKNATVHFEGSEMACYLFLRIETVGWERKSDGTYACAVDGTDMLTWRVDSAWTFLSADSGGTVYYRIVPANTPLETAVLADGGKITVSPGLTRTQLERLTNSLTTELSIDIEATAMQYHGVEEGLAPGYTREERAIAAWNMVRGK